MAAPIPQPPAFPLIGNITDVDPQNGILSLQHLAEKYGPIFKLSFFGTDKYFISSAELLSELCDEKRFHKTINANLEEVRNGVGDGLFTAYHGEHSWEIAHRTLTPAFGPIGIQDMYDEMYDIATQLVAKWARQGSERIDVTDDFTRLTLDSIALCTMDKRFNSFYSEKMHPFVGAMMGFLVESGRKARRTRIEQLFSRKAQAQYEQDISTMREVATEVMNHRRANPTDKKDLLQVLLFGKDPKTGEKLSDESIMNNMITFLIAGHETTSGLLSFACYYMLKHPDAMRKAQQEVDSVVGTGPIKFQHMSKLPYIEAIMRETLRLQPTAPAFSLEPHSAVSGPTLLAGKYYVPAGATITAILPSIGRDPAAFGADADEFRPERMYRENFEKLPPNAWKPFGNGARGCIGRPFAWQEAILALALILQNFNLRFDDASYQLRIKTTLTIKPDGFFMRANLREGIDPVKLEKKMYAGLSDKTDKSKTPKAITDKGSKPMTILFGSNSGTCEGLAQSLAGNATGHGYKAAVRSLDSAVEQVPADQPVVIITASYEGNPPDNANAFVEWLKTVETGKFTNTQYAVFGCGHRDWIATFQKVPTLIDDELASKGASRIAERGLCDVAAGTIFDEFDAWQDNSFWPAISNKRSDAAFEGLDLEISTTSRATHLRHSVQDAVVLKNDVLTAPGAPVKRHTEFKLPTSMTYEAGDYLAILPMNNMQTISRVLRRFGLPWDAVMTLKKGAHTTIPTDQEMTIAAVLSSYVELNSPITKKSLATIATYAPDEIKTTMNNTSGTPSVLDILESQPKIALPFSVFLSMLNPMRIRQYSISSSPLNDPTVATITYSVVQHDSAHLGVATNYLASLQPGSIAHVAVKKSHTSFHLPLDEKIPVIMIGAGTGLAPFRGFVQERAARIQSTGRNDFGEAVLFVGCRDPEKDKLYAEEFAEWQKIGAVQVKYAFSQAARNSEGCKHVQDRVWYDRELARKLFDEGARAYICGSAAVGKGLAEVVAKIVEEGAKRDGKSATYEEGLKWWEGLRGERYAVDVFD